MLKLLIKAIADTEDLPHLHMDGISGRPYLFTWNKEVKAYTTEPKGQEEIDDIFASMKLPGFPWQFAPVLVEVEGDPANPKVAKIPPFIPPAGYAGHNIEELIALCEDCGFTPRQHGDRDAVAAQLDAYMIGRAWAVKAPASNTNPPARPQKVAAEPVEVPPPDASSTPTADEPEVTEVP